MKPHKTEQLEQFPFIFENGYWSAQKTIFYPNRYFELLRLPSMKVIQCQCQHCF